MRRIAPYLPKQPKVDESLEIFQIHWNFLAKANTEKFRDTLSLHKSKNFREANLEKFYDNPL